MSHAHTDRRFDSAHAARLDAPDRRESIPPRAIVAALDPHPGEVIADLGCGTGYFLWPVVEALGGEGVFYAIDSSPGMLEHLRARAEAHPLGSRVTPLLSSDERVPLEAGSLDAALLGSVYHEIADRPGYLRELSRLLRARGRLVLIDWRPLAPGEERLAGPPADHRLTEASVRAELEAAGFAVESRPEAFARLYCLIARKR
jgi:ubiquinone/menaquinone biosynthesis C-methylase UbiE